MRLALPGLLLGHNFLFDRFILTRRVLTRRGLTRRYLALATARPVEVMALCRRLGFGGLSVTMPAKRALLPALGRWLRRVHDRGVYHGDWSAKNVLVVETEGPPGWQFLLGVSNMMIEPPLIYLVSRELQASYSVSMVAAVADTTTQCFVLLALRPLV